MLGMERWTDRSQIPSAVAQCRQRETETRKIAFWWGMREDVQARLFSNMWRHGKLSSRGSGGRQSGNEFNPASAKRHCLRCLRSSPSHLSPQHTLCTVQIVANSSRQSRDNEKALHLYENVVKMKTSFQSWHSLTSTLHESARKPFSTSRRCWSWHFKSQSLYLAFKSRSPEKMGASCHNVWFTHFENIWCRAD